MLHTKYSWSTRTMVLHTKYSWPNQGQNNWSNCLTGTMVLHTKHSWSNNGSWCYTPSTVGPANGPWCYTPNTFGPTKGPWCYTPMNTTCPRKKGTMLLHTSHDTILVISHLSVSHHMSLPHNVDISCLCAWSACLDRSCFLPGPHILDSLSNRHPCFCCFQSDWPCLARG